MKLLIGTLILSGTASVFAQDAAPVPPTPPTVAKEARVAVMSANGSNLIVGGVTKNQPFTADESGESVRVLPDGNRITENWSGKIARNSQGHIRREITSGKPGSGGSRPFIFEGGALGPAAVSIAAGQGLKYQLETEAAAAGGSRGYVLAAPSEKSSVSVVTTTGQLDANRAAMLAKVEAAAVDGARMAVNAEKLAVEARAMSVGGVGHYEEGKVQTRKESLGTRDFGGVQADGTRVVTTYAAGAMGNEREIEVTSEVWFSKELGVIVYSRRSDPRTGDTTYQMTNIVRAEPDPSLFTKR